MRIDFRHFRNASWLGLGQVIQRGFGFLLAAVISRKLGAATLGEYSLFLAASQLMIAFIDSGSRYTGARLVARFPDAAHALIAPVQRMRVKLALAALAPLAVYAVFLSPEVRWWVVLYACSTLPYALRLDWWAWGAEKFSVMGLAPSLTSAISTCLAVLAILWRRDLWAWVLILGNGLGQGVTALWIKWRLRILPQMNSTELAQAIRAELHWRRIGIVGLAVILNQILQSSGIYVLGLLALPAVVGFYGGAYRLFYVILAGFYLILQAAYPAASRLRDGADRWRYGIVGLGLVLLAGAGGGLILYFLAPWLVAFVYGRNLLPAVPVLRALAWLLPLDMACSILATFLVAVSGEFYLLCALLLVLSSNILLCWLWRFQGALGAADAMIAAYAFFFALLFFLYRRHCLQLQPDQARSAAI